MYIIFNYYYFVLLRFWVQLLFKIYDYIFYNIDTGFKTYENTNTVLILVLYTYTTTVILFISRNMC